MPNRSNSEILRGTANKKQAYAMHKYISGEILTVFESGLEASRKALGSKSINTGGQVAGMVLSYIKRKNKYDIQYKKRIQDQKRLTKPKEPTPTKKTLPDDYITQDGEVIEKGTEVYFTRYYPKK